MPPVALQSQPVIYFAPAYAPHLWLFHCQVQHMDLSREACANFHVRKHTAACARCPIGAHHAGRQAPPQHLAESTCARCEGHASRIIQGRLCVSCFNRQGEVERGRDRKGNAPRLTLHTADMLIFGPPPEIGYAREPIDADHTLLSCQVRDLAELERTIQRIEATGTKVLDSSISPRRPLVIFKPLPSRHGKTAWSVPLDQHSQPRSHANELHPHP
ncbi:hypothetical protein [Thauera mechernichensis]